MIERITSLPKLPQRPVEGHKGLFGRVLVVGGSEGMLGAPVLAGTAALRVGAGLVQVAMPRALLAAGLSVTPELIGLGLGKSVKKDAALAEMAQAADAAVVGPGMGQSPAARTRVKQLIRLEKPMVLDADALNILASEKRWPKTFNARAVLTPHPGEMKRLGRFVNITEIPADDDGRSGVAASAATTFAQIVVLKGHRTVVTDGKRTYINETGDSSLSKAGSGDVLSGIIATLLAQKMDPFDAACAAVWLHGKSGELAGARLGRRCVLASDVIDTLADALRDYENQP